VTRRNAALGLLVAALICFGVALASLVASDVAVNEAAWVTGGFLLVTSSQIVERLHG